DLGQIGHVLRIFRAVPAKKDAFAAGEIFEKFACEKQQLLLLCRFDVIEARVGRHIACVKAKAVGLHRDGHLRLAILERAFEFKREVFGILKGAESRLQGRGDPAGCNAGKTEEVERFGGEETLQEAEFAIFAETLKLLYKRSALRLHD